MVDREAIKDRVLAYLDRKVRTKRTPDLKSFTVESISAAIREDERIVERVLAELERDNWVRSTNIQFRIYLPTSAESQRTLTSLAQAGALTFPPFLSAAAGITAVYLIFAYQAPAPEEIFEVAKHGGQLDGVIAAGILGLGTGLGFHTLLRRLLRWRLIASGPYARLVQNLKWVFAGGLLGLLGYIGVAWGFDIDVRQDVAAGLLGAGSAIGLGLCQVVHRQSSDPAKLGSLTSLGAGPHSSTADEE